MNMASRLDLSEVIASVVEQGSGSVVRVEARHRRPSSGTVWSSDGVVIAADHSIERDDGIEVGLSDGRTFEASLVGRDPGTDIAVLRVQGADLKPANWFDGDGIKVGHLVVALARPGRTARATLGIVSALGGEWKTPAGGRVDRYLETDLELPSGFSGGFLLDLEGRAIGLNTTGLWRGHHLSIPTVTLRKTVETLLAHGAMRRGFIGVGTFPVRLTGKAEQQAPQKVALLVISVQPGSPADRAGLTLGDALLAANGRTLTQIDDLLEVLTEESIGKELSLQVLRAGQVQDLAVTVGSRS
jgi:S1-C subfamily serine protease